MARPSKIDRFIEVAKDVLFRDGNISNKDLRILVNKKLGYNFVCKKTIQRWKSLGKLECIGIYPNPNKIKTVIKFVNQKQYQKDYYHNVKKNSLNNKIKNSFATLLRYHLKNKTAKTFDCVGYTLDDLKNHLESLFEQGMSWENYGFKGWHIDHVTPASWFDYNSKDDIEFKKCWCLSNLQPKWAIDNIKKQNRYVG